MENGHVGSTELRALDSKTGFEPWTHHLQLEEPWAKSLTLHFLICKVGVIMVPISKGYGKDRMALAGLPAPCTRKLKA